MTEPIEHAEVADVTPAAPAPAPGRIRWYHVAALGVAVLACSAAVGFFASRSADRHDATSKRHAAEAAVLAQRAATADAGATLARDRSETKTALAGVDQLTTSLRDLTGLTAQEVGVVTSVNQLAVSSPSSADEINAKLDQSHTLIDQLNAKAQQIIDQAQQLEQQAGAQYTAKHT